MAYVASVLRRTRHNGFPVVHGGGPDPERDEGEFDALGGGASRSGPLEGVILRSQLLVLLGSQARPGGQGRVGQGRIILTLPATLWSAVRATRGAAAHGASRARRAGRPRRVHLSHHAARCVWVAQPLRDRLPGAEDRRACAGVLRRGRRAAVAGAGRAAPGPRAGAGPQDAHVLPAPPLAAVRPPRPRPFHMRAPACCEPHCASHASADSASYKRGRWAALLAPLRAA